MLIKSIVAGRHLAERGEALAWWPPYDNPHARQLKLSRLYLLDEVLDSSAPGLTSNIGFVGLDGGRLNINANERPEARHLEPQRKTTTSTEKINE
jgi:hypothetical protein